MCEGPVTRPMLDAGSHRLLVSRITVVLFALVSSYYALYTLRNTWIPHAEIGIAIDVPPAIVNDVEPRLAVAGIRVGYRVDLAAMPFRLVHGVFDDALVV